MPFCLASTAWPRSLARLLIAAQAALETTGWSSVQVCLLSTCSPLDTPLHTVAVRRLGFPCADRYDPAAQDAQCAAPVMTWEQTGTALRSCELSPQPRLRRCAILPNASNDDSCNRSRLSRVRCRANGASQSPAIRWRAAAQPRAPRVAANPARKIQPESPAAPNRAPQPSEDQP